MTTKTKDINKKKITLREFVWYGFNFTASVGFIGAYALISSPYVGSGSGFKRNPYAIGLNGIWVFLLVGLIAAVCAWGFAKLSRVHKSEGNGAAYIYTRTSFGRLAGFIVCGMQYITMPFLITVQILFLIRGSFDPNYAGNTFVSASWGSFSDLYLDLIGIVIYGAAGSLVFLGIKSYKLTNNISSSVKWATAGIFILAAIFLCAKNGAANYAYWTKPVTDNPATSGGAQLSFKGVLNAFTASFFYFAGFETFSTAGRNTENPERTIGLGIMLVILICLVFYIGFSFIAFGALRGLGNPAYQNQYFVQNTNIGLWNWFNQNSSAVKWIYYAGIILMLISSLGLKIQAASQNILFGGTLLQPLSKEGYVSDNLRKLNRDHIPARASFANLMITFGISVLWLFIPDIIIGSIKASGGNSQNIANIFSLNFLTSVSSDVTLFVYGCVILTVLKLGYEGRLRMKFWEWAAFPIALPAIVFIIIYSGYSFIASAAAQPVNTFAWFQPLLFFLFVFGAFGVILCIYFFYYKPKYQFRKERNPQLQARLDAQFVLVDDWSYVCMRMRTELNGYMKRNKLLFAGNTNKSIESATLINQQVQQAIDDFNHTLEQERAHDADYIDE